jgi:hypothetical protein
LGFILLWEYSFIKETQIEGFHQFPEKFKMDEPKKNEELPRIIMEKTEKMEGFGEWDILVLYSPAKDISKCKDPNKFIPSFFCTDMVSKDRGICIPLPRALICSWDDMIDYAIKVVDANVKPPPPGTKRKFFAKCFRDGLIPTINGMEPFYGEKKTNE